MKAKHLELPLVAGSSIGHKPHLHYYQVEHGPNLKTQITPQRWFVLDSSHNADALIEQFIFDQFSFN